MADAPKTAPKTEIRRETVLQEARIIVEPKGYWRKIQILTPASPEVLVINDMLPEELGLDRVYKMPVMPPSIFVKFCLAPGQFLTAASQNGIANCTVIESAVEEALRG